MDSSVWITWVIQLAVTTAIGIIAYYIKRSQQAAEAKMTDQSKRITKLEDKTAELPKIAEQAERIKTLEGKMDELPYLYTMREDFILSMGKVEAKLDKILDRIPNSKEE